MNNLGVLVTLVILLIQPWMMGEVKFKMAASLTYQKVYFT